MPLEVSETSLGQPQDIILLNERLVTSMREDITSQVVCDVIVRYIVCFECIELITRLESESC